jgi:hypothetical protein
MQDANPAHLVTGVARPAIAALHDARLRDAEERGGPDEISRRNLRLESPDEI